MNIDEMKVCDHHDDTEAWVEYCPDSEDNKHCSCWWDGLACCYCGDPPTHDKYGNKLSDLENGIKQYCTFPDCGCYSSR